VQPPLAVTIWLPETLSMGGAARLGEAKERKPKRVNRGKYPGLMKRSAWALKRFSNFKAEKNPAKFSHPFKDALSLKAVLSG
jgi:hypothetical protein